GRVGDGIPARVLPRFPPRAAPRAAGDRKVRRADALRGELREARRAGARAVRGRDGPGRRPGLERSREMERAPPPGHRRGPPGHLGKARYPDRAPALAPRRWPFGASFRQHHLVPRRQERRLAIRLRLPMATYPEDLRYTKEHEWTRLAGKNATVGITAFAKDQLGDVVYLELPEVGAAVTKGQPFGVVESTKAVSELFAPVSGKVTKVNQALVEAPEQINDDPYEKGWMIEIELSAPGETSELLSAKQYADLVATEH